MHTDAQTRLHTHTLSLTHTHTGKAELAAASLGLAYYNTVYFPLSGVAMALDTLFSQAASRH